MERFFQGRMDLGRVRLVFGGILTLGGYARTLGNTIAFPMRYLGDYQSLDSRCWLVHELTHVWQNQVLGKRYIPGALWEHFWYADPYAYALEPEAPFSSYGYEAQAALVADLFRSREMGESGSRREILEERFREMGRICGRRRWA